MCLFDQQKAKQNQQDVFNYVYLIIALQNEQFLWWLWPKTSLSPGENSTEQVMRFHVYNSIY